MADSWRQVVLTCVGIGEELEVIRQCLRRVNATEVVNDYRIVHVLAEAVRASKHLLTELESLRNHADSHRLEGEPDND